MSVVVNGIVVDVTDWPSPELAAVRELLRQRACAVGMLAADTLTIGTTTGALGPDGGEEGADAEVDAGVNAAMNAAVDAAIERLLADEVQVPQPTEAECRRHYDTHPQDFRSGDLVYARHILFQVTPAASVADIRSRAEQTLAVVLEQPDDFAALAAELSNCPSGQQQGNLGQIGRGDTVPEFEQMLFGDGTIGILRELVKTRYGFHVVAVDRRIAGAVLPYEAVRERIAARLKTGVEQRALRQYVSVLAGQADIEGVDLNAASSPLVQ